MVKYSLMIMRCEHLRPYFNITQEKVNQLKVIPLMKKPMVNPPLVNPSMNKSVNWFTSETKWLASRCGKFEVKNWFRYPIMKKVRFYEQVTRFLSPCWIFNRRLLIFHVALRCCSWKTQKFFNHDCDNMETITMWKTVLQNRKIDFTWLLTFNWL